MKLQVIKNGSRYYSSYLGNKQQIYAFVKEEPLKKCTQFITEYKDTHSKYPPADNTILKASTIDDEDDYIYVDTEDSDELQRRCYMFNAGLSIVESFDYDFTSTNFTVNVSAADILPDISHKERARLLNYALTLSEDDDDYGSDGE